MEIIAGMLIGFAIFGMGYITGQLAGYHQAIGDMMRTGRLLDKPE